MSETNEPSGVYPIGKAVLGAVWLFATACFLPPLNGEVSSACSPSRTSSNAYFSSARSERLAVPS